MHYRLAATEDLPALSYLLEQGGLEHPPVEALLTATTLVAAAPNGTILGMFMAVVQGQHAFLELLVVHPEWRHSGLGVKLIGRMLKLAGKLGARYFYGAVADEHAEMLKIYKALGADIGPRYSYVTGDLYGKEN